MAVWVGWELGRAVLVLTGVLFVGIWVQVSLMHWAGGFKHLAMWGPVVTTPLFAAAALAGVVTRAGAFGWGVVVLMAIAVLKAWSAWRSICSASVGRSAASASGTCSPGRRPCSRWPMP